MPTITFCQRLMRWLQPKPAKSHTRTSAAAPSGREAMRQKRSEQRHKLQAVARENMIRAGVLSGAYKFKALPLDHESQSFMVLFDIDCNAMAHDHQSLDALESSLQTLAKERANIEVKSVYWRMHVGHDKARSESPPPQPIPHRREFAPTQRLGSNPER